MTFPVTEHARQELARRNIPPEVLQAVLEQPGQVVPVRQGRKAYQSKREFDGIMFIVRAIVDDGSDPAVVVTVYRTTKIKKYWS